LRIPNLLKNQYGLSLVEVLATLAIMSIIALTLFSVITSSKVQHNKQSHANKQINDASFALKLITKDIRKYPNNIIANDTSLSISIDSDSTETIVYSFEDTEKTINKDGVPFVSDIEVFKAIPCESGLSDCTFIEIGNNEKTVSTEIILRKGNNSQ